VQALHLMNSRRLMTRIGDSSGRATWLARSPRSARGIVTELYLAAFSRYPTEEEMKVAAASFSGKDAAWQAATEDLMWALMNSAEFVLNH
jgi:hypothetical protein